MSGRILFGMILWIIAQASAGASTDPSWAVADHKWEAFKQALLRALPDTPTLVQITHPTLKQYMPDYRLYGDHSVVYVLSKQGTVWMRGDRSTDPPGCRRPACEVKDVSAMLAAVGIRVRDAETAVDVVRLFELLTSNGYVPEDGNLFGDWRAVARAIGRREWRVDFVYKDLRRRA